MKYLTNAEAMIERNLLRLYEDAYPRAVELVATALRGRFEAGELRGWIEGEDDRDGVAKVPMPPLWRLEKECARRFIKTPLRALAVVQFSPNAGVECPWSWDKADGGEFLLGAAETAMAWDVLHFARAHGWSKPRRGEYPPFKRSTRRAA